MKRVVIFGGTGFIGRILISELLPDYEVVVISRQRRNAQKELGDKVIVERLKRTDITKIIELINGSWAVINLAGENVGTRWSQSKMDKIRNSRLDVDSVIVRAIKMAKDKPKVLLQGSAIGVYGYSRIDKDLTEESSLGQRGFLPKLAISHEEAVHQLESTLRVVYLRTGMVLGAEGGAMPKLMLQYKFFAGGKLGNGKQWTSWIHVRDEAIAIRFLMENEDCYGAYNLTAPNPVTNKEFSGSLAKAMNRPNFATAPAFILRLFLGQMAKELLLSGVKVLPDRLLTAGFKFTFQNIDTAFNDIINKS